MVQNIELNMDALKVHMEINWTERVKKNVLLVREATTAEEQG